MPRRVGVGAIKKQQLEKVSILKALIRNLGTTKLFVTVIWEKILNVNVTPSGSMSYCPV